MDLHELGRALGWVGGVLYLGTVAEQKVRAILLERKLAKMMRDGPALSSPPTGASIMRMHSVTCTVCGEGVLMPGCEHPDAPVVDFSQPPRPKILRPPES